MKKIKKKAVTLLVISMVLSMFIGIPLNVSAQNGDTTGLLVKDWIDWDENGYPSVNEAAEVQKEPWSDLYGSTLYLGYAESEGSDLTTVTPEQISVQYNGETAGDDKVRYTANEKNAELIDFSFYEIGDYTVTYNAGGQSSTVIIHVGYPLVGFYKTSTPSVENLIKEDFQYTEGGDNKFYMIFHRTWSKLDLEHIKYSKDGEEIADITQYFTITAPEFSLSDNPSDYTEDKDYVYEVQIKENMKDSFWLDVEVQRTDVFNVGDDESPSYEFAEESYAISRGIGISYTEKMEGLLVKDWIDCDENGYPSVNEAAEVQKETGADLNGRTLYLGYAESEGAALTVVTADNISVQYNGEAAGEDKVQYKTNDQNPELTDFIFYKVGEYTVSYTAAGGKSSSIIIYVDYPDVGFYETDQMTEAGYIRNVGYERGTEKTFYVIPNTSEGRSYTYKIITEDVLGNGAYIHVDGTVPGPDKEMHDKAKVTITADAKGNFGLKAVGTVTYGDEDTNEFDYYVPCEDTYEPVIIEDGKVHNGFAGCFIPQEMYDFNHYEPALSDIPLYWVHADSLQGVVDELVRVAKQGSVTVNGQTYTIENSGYMWVNVSYLPDYEVNGKATQYVTTPSDVEGIILASNIEMYYTQEKSAQGTYYPVKRWIKDAEEMLTCLKDEDGKYYPVTKTGDIFNVTVGGTGKTEEEMVLSGYGLDEDYGIHCEWQELHVDATTNVKIVGDFAEAEEGKANIYLGLYKDSDIVSYISDGEDENGDVPFTEITSDKIGQEDFITGAGLKVSIVELKANMDKTVVGNFVSTDAVTVEEEGKALRDKIAIEDLIATDEDLKRAIIDGESLDVSMNVKTVEQSDTEAAEGINKISALVKTGKNDTSTIQYLDIGLKYQVGTKTGDITETTDDIAINIDLPKDFAKAHRDFAKSWKPVVYRYHDGKAEKLDSIYDDGRLVLKTGKFSVYAIAIEEVVPTGIKIITPPVKTAYRVGDMFDKKGMVVELIYSDGSTKEITDYTVSSAALTEAEKEISVVYGAYTAKQEITVQAASIPPVEPLPITPPLVVVPQIGENVTVDGAHYTVTSAGDNKKTVTYTASSKNVAVVTIPDTVTINGAEYKVTAIADKAFFGNKKLTTVKISSEVADIGKNAFSGCAKLKTVTIGTKVTVIGDKAFYKCTALKKITIPSNVNRIGKQAFSGCKNLKTITIKTVKLTSKNVGSKAFKGIHSKAVIKVPKKKLASYKRILKAKGVSSKAKIKK